MKSKWDLKSEDLFVDNPIKIAVVASLFNPDITKELVRCCLYTLEEYGYSSDRVDVLWVPGAWEIPQVAKKVADGDYNTTADEIDALIAMGCVIKGETPHFDFVAGEATRGISKVARQADFPVIFGILTVDTWEQAWARASEAKGNKGREFAKSTLHMINLYRQNLK